MDESECVLHTMRDQCGYVLCRYFFLLSSGRLLCVGITNLVIPEAGITKLLGIEYSWPEDIPPIQV